MPDRLCVTRRLSRRPGAGRRTGVRVMVVGDLTLDVVLIPAGPLVEGSDVAGLVRLRQGGSAANTARWLSRLGAHTQLVCAVGRDGPGRALVADVRADGVIVRASRIPGWPTGRIGVIVAVGGERSFVADRGAADRLAPADLRPAWFASIDLLHLPAYSLLGEPLGSAGRAAVGLARSGGALVSLDLASVGPLLAGGRSAARALVQAIAPDVLLATASELAALLGPADRVSLGARALQIAPLVVVKHGARGAAVHLLDQGGASASFEVATRPLAVTDSTGAGDAFDAGFLAGFVEARHAGRVSPADLRRAVLAGHRAAARQLSSGKPELDLG
ncbi:MAG: carbohydrate kinase family protein [Candidatus Limnocylindrales bacterium]